MIPQRFLPILVLLGCTAAADHRHLKAQTSPPPATTELVREAVAGLSEQAQATHRFTYFELAHTQNRNEKGKLYYDRTTLTETTYIADLPFDRLVEVDGKPLTGKALAEEQSRYDQAVHDRSALDASARARLDHQRLIKAGLPYSQLTTRFHLTDLRTEEASAQPAHVIDATPIPSTNPALPTESRHVRLWITSPAPGTTPHLLRADFDYLTPEKIDGNEIEPGSHGSITFTLIDGVAVPAHIELHSTVLAGGANGKPIQVDVDRTFSRYRQFTSTIRILPVESPTPQ